MPLSLWIKPCHLTSWSFPSRKFATYLQNLGLTGYACGSNDAKRAAVSCSGIGGLTLQAWFL